MADKNEEETAAGEYEAPTDESKPVAETAPAQESVSSFLKTIQVS